MITKFKIFEWHSKTPDGSATPEDSIPDDENDLVELFSQKEVEEYFDKHYDISAEEAAQAVNIWNYVDDEEVKKFFINTMMQDKNNKTSREYYEEKWEDTEPSEIFEEIWGKGARYDAYDYISHLVDKVELIEDYKNIVDYSAKDEFLKNSIATDYDLQKKLLDENKNTVFALFDVIESGMSFGDTYEFQKEFINQSVEIENLEDNDKEEIIAHAIRDINNKFKLNKKIKKEYSEYLYLIDADKYNL